MLELETELLCVERDRASHIGYLVADAVNALDERVCIYARGCGVWHVTLLSFSTVGNERLFCARIAKTEPPLFLLDCRATSESSDGRERIHRWDQRPAALQATRSCPRPAPANAEPMDRP